jgi:hypothetical protein
MDLTALLAYTRLLADELDAAPDGVFEDTDLTIVLNVAKDKVYLDLVDLIPQRFRKSKKITLIASQREYVISTGLLVTDLMAIEVIVRNIAGKRPWPLIEISPEQEHQFMENPTYADSYPSGWMREAEDSLTFLPIASAGLADALKMYYFMEIPDLSALTPTVAPALPRLAHPLICLDALRQWGIRTAEGQAAVDARYAETLESVVQKLSMKSALRGGQLPGTIEMSGYGEDIVES